MPLFTAKARPRLTRSATSIKKNERKMYMYMYFLALTLLLVVSVTIVQLLFGGSSAPSAQGNLWMLISRIALFYCLANVV